ncbi:o-succinylbenzoate--CoA ligase [Agrilactobacillus fermenti]|uniref:o-succinylbenzoate--CoA ligase n=1 Tax=Agrilactobacillus fermenti TaxID=2586909 RepID=UPI003A5BB5B4
MENWLKKRSQLSAEKIALVYQDKHITFSELNQMVQQLAGQINQQLTDQRPVAVIGNNNLITYQAILAVHQLGLPLVLLNFRLSVRELNLQLSDAQPQLVILDQALSNQISPEQLNMPTITTSELTRAAIKPFQVQAEFKNDQLADIMYTSGSTGRPKGVMQTFGNHFYSAIGTGLNFQLTDQDAWLCAVPLFHISGLSIMMRSLIYGLTVYLEPKFSAQRINELLSHEPVTIISVVPYMLKKLLAALPLTQHYQSKFRIMFLGGGPTDQQTLTACQQRHIPVVQSYGMTETASNVVALNFKDAQRKLGSSGQALFPVQLRIDHPKNKKLGEIQLKSPTIAQGYLNQPELFQKKFTPDHWFKTGDVGYLDADHFLFVKGRQDTMFISGGENIFPNEIEDVYHNYPDIQEIVISHESDPQWGAIPIAYIVAKPQAQLSTQTLTTFGRQYLAHYKVPKKFYLLKTLPRTGNGKIDYRGIHALHPDVKQLLSN